MDAETFYHLGKLAVEIATEYLEVIPQKPVYRPMTPSERQLLLYQQLPEHGRSPEALFDFFELRFAPANHVLQSAALALKNGMSEEIIMMALPCLSSSIMSL